jgi:hypothetical protein
MYEMNTDLAHAAANLLCAVRGTEGFDLADTSAHVEYALKEREYICIGYQSWGRGRSQADAVDNMVKAGGKRNHYALYEVPLGTTVSGMGSFVYPGAMIELFGDDAKPKQIAAVEPKTRRRK